MNDANLANVHSFAQCASHTDFSCPKLTSSALEVVPSYFVKPSTYVFVYQHKHGLGPSEKGRC